MAIRSVQEYRVYVFQKLSTNCPQSFFIFLLDVFIAFCLMSNVRAWRLGMLEV